MKTIQFTAVDDGRALGTVTLTDDGVLEYENEDRRKAMGPMVARVGAAKAFEWFSDWSNGMVRSQLVDDTAQAAS